MIVLQRYRIVGYFRTVQISSSISLSAYSVKEKLKCYNCICLFTDDKTGKLQYCTARANGSIVLTKSG